MDFVRDFLNYVDKQGIYDEFDREANKMRTSAGVEALIKEARSYIPPTLDGIAAGNLMRDLPDSMRDALIAQADEKRVIDMRSEFAKRQAANGGARGLLEDMVEALETRDDEKMQRIFQDAVGIIRGGENVPVNDAE